MVLLFEKEKKGSRDSFDNVLSNKLLALSLLKK